METFADQAAIAIENARLLTELQAKNADLTEALEQQTATAEILRVICSSPTDVQPVFDTIVRSAVQLSAARHRGAVYRLRRRACSPRRPPQRARPEVLAGLQRAYPDAADARRRCPAAPSSTAAVVQSRTCRTTRSTRRHGRPGRRFRSLLGGADAAGRGQPPSAPSCHSAAGAGALRRRTSRAAARPSPTRRSSPSRTSASSTSWRRATASCGWRSSSRRRPASCSR